MSAALTLRPIRDADRDFLSRLYASTRADEMALVDWTEDEKRAFLTFQFEAQHKYYVEQFPDAELQLVLIDGEPVGRLYVDRRPDEIRLIDVALLPEHRGRGIGGGMMRRLLEEGERAGKPVRIHVEHNNPAKRLYRRLGFREIEDRGVYHLMEWSPRVATVAGGGGA